MAFTIKELESLTGIKAHTIRIWEQRYNFLKPSRTTTNIRVYNGNELKTLLNVALLNKYGYKISRIDEMHEEERQREILQITQKEAQDEYIVNLLIGYMIDLEVNHFEEILNGYIKNNGLTDTIHSIIFFFLEKIGILWQTNRINPAHEHIVSNIIRQKVITAIEQLPPSFKNPLFVLFLPEDEHHELGLLYVYYLLKSKGLSVMYLGADVPINDVQYIYNIKQPQFFYLHLTSLPPNISFHKYIHALNNKLQNARILISGGVAQNFKRDTPDNVVLLKSFSEVTSYIATL